MRPVNWVSWMGGLGHNELILCYVLSIFQILYANLFFIMAILRYVLKIFITFLIKSVINIFL